MFDMVEFNTKEKMERCFKLLSADKDRKAHTVFIVGPPQLAKYTKYYVYYLRKEL